MSRPRSPRRPSEVPESRPRSRSPRRGAAKEAAPAPRDLDRPSPASPLSVGSSAIQRDTAHDAATDDRVDRVDHQDEESDPDGHIALPVEIFDDKAVPGPVRAGTPAKVQETQTRRRADAKEAAKFAAPRSSRTEKQTRTQPAAPARSGAAAKQVTPLMPASSSRELRPKAESGKDARTAASGRTRPAKNRQKAASSTVSGASAPPKDSKAPGRRAADEEPPPGDLSWVVSWDQLNESEQHEFKETVLDELHSLHIDVDDAELVSDFISVHVWDKKQTHQDIVKELQFLGKEAEPFVRWVEGYKDKVSTKTLGAQAGLRAQLTPNQLSDAASHAAPISSSSLKSALASRTTPRRAAAPSKSLSRTPKGTTQNPHVVVTKRLVLQPNPVLNPDNEKDDSGSEESQSPPPSVPPPSRKRVVQAQVVQASPPPLSGSSRSSSSSCSSVSSGHEDSARPAQAPGGPSADEKRMNLLGEMTNKLQAILAKLSDKTLDDLSREKYQALAETIQITMSKMSSPADDSAAGSWAPAPM